MHVQQHNKEDWHRPECGQFTYVCMHAASWSWIRFVQKLRSKAGSLVKGLAREVRALPAGLICVDVVDVTLCAHIWSQAVVERGDPGDAAGLLTGVTPGHVELQAVSTSSSSACQEFSNMSRASAGMQTAPSAACCSRQWCAASLQLHHCMAHLACRHILPVTGRMASLT